MNVKNNTILITGGSNGIGLALAERFLNEGNTVIICGRNEAKLQEAKQKLPNLHTEICDVAKAEERIALYEKLIREFPTLNVLVNNAGVQQRFNLMELQEDWKYYQQEIAINFEAPIHLSMLFLSHFANMENAAIVNVSSGLAFTPMAAAPVYCATKAAIHNFTISLRYQLAESGIEAIEIAPPAVATDLGGKGLHAHAAPLDEFTNGVFDGLAKGLQEIGYGSSEARLRMNRDELDAMTKEINGRIPFK